MTGILDLIPRLAVGLVPVSVFLLALIYLDSYKLVTPRTLALVLLCGAAAAGASYAVNVTLLREFEVPFSLVTRYIAPVVEECLKAVPLILLIRSGRVGFLVDAAILGFAVGTGFALVENLHYLQTLQSASFLVWIVRGFGTAIMHGGTTAILAIVSRAAVSRGGDAGPIRFLPGLAAAIAIHSGFNHFPVSPVALTAGILCVLPPSILLAYRRSESSLEDWLSVGFDADTDLLRMMQSGEFAESRIGRYLESLREHFPGEVVVDMLCFLRLHAELALAAKGVLMLRESGLDVPRDPELDPKLAELAHLERSIGKTGMQAILPFVHRSQEDVWQLRLVGRP